MQRVRQVWLSLLKTCDAADCPLKEQAQLIHKPRASHRLLLRRG